MTVWPVIERELRAEARHPFNYWVRVLAASAVSIVFALIIWDQPGSPAELGARLFSTLNATVFVTIWILVPLLISDCISREKREGTLGLLFLTPLTSGGIVLGKSLIHGLRASTLFLAALPVLALPFLLGGVTWQNAAFALLLNLAAMLLAMAAGLLASSWAKDWARAFILGEAFSLILVSLLSSIHRLGYIYLQNYLGSYASLRGSRSGTVPSWNEIWHGFWRQSLWEDSLSLVFWQDLWGREPAAMQQAWLQWIFILFALSLGFLMLAVLFAVQRVRSSWQEEPPSRRQLWLLKTFCTPFLWRALFRSKMSRKLDRNPMGWLQQYSWSARLSRWGWCLGIILVECLLVSDSSLSRIWSGQYWLAYLLMLSLAFTASGSFRSERQSGALELILVTPLSENQIIGGRLRGIWSQFLPAALVLALAWWQLAQDATLFAGLSRDRAGLWGQVIFPLYFLSGFLTLPWIGLYFSMQRLNFIAAWLFTCATGLLLPRLIYLWGLQNFSLMQTVYGMIGLQLACGVTALVLLHRNLTRRAFVLD